MNAYSTDFVQGLEALSQSLSQVLANLGDTDNSTLGRLAGNTIMLAAAEFDRSGQAAAAGRPSLPDPRLVRRIIRQRQLRSRYFPNELFADPAWDMLLDLTAATAEHQRVSVTSLCLASGVPPTTALRWIAQMEDAGLVRRQSDSTDKRRAFIVLSESAITIMARYFQAIGPGGSHLV